MTVRYACLADVPRILELAREEHAISIWRDIPFDPAPMKATIEHFIRTQGHTLLMSDGGYLAGMVQPFGFSMRLVAMEWAWFANDGSGLALLRRFKHWASNMGAVQLVMHSYTGNEQINKVLERRMQFRVIGQALALNLES